MIVLLISENTNKDASISGNIKDIDANFINAFRENGDIEAFTILMNKYKKTVLNFCFRYTGNMEDAEDISQDVFVKVFRHISSFRGESKFTTWLYRLTMNTCHNHKRWNRPERIQDVESIAAEKDEEENRTIEILDHSANPELLFINRELGMQIDKMVAKLNYKQRSVLILKDFQGRSYEEIAEIMNMNIGTVKSVLSRGRMNVAMKIKEYCKP